MNDADDDIPAVKDDPGGRFMALVLRYLDGQNSLDEAERQELNRLLRDDPVRRRQLAMFCTHAWLIRETYSPEHVARAKPRRRAGHRMAMAGVLLLLAGCIALAIFTRNRGVDVSPPSTPGPVIASLGALSGTAWVTAPGGAARDAQTGGEIRSGDELRLDGQGAIAEVNYPDGTRVLLLGRTSITLRSDPAKSIGLHGGMLSASVTPQPGDAPMTLTTPSARLRVVGTEFSVSADDARTDLRVTQGRVALTRTADGNSVEVPAGKSTIARGQTPLVVSDISGPPATWEQDFEVGLPPGMTRGRWVSEGLPRGSRGGVAMVRRASGKDGEYFEIGTAESWQDGHFAIHPDSHLHFTFKMANPAWLNVFVICRRFESSGPHSINHLFDELRFWDSRPNQWRTVTIPLSRFKRLANVPGEPFENQVPYMLLFSAEAPDRGLVIDRMWVTQSGPGRVVYSDVE